VVPALLMLAAMMTVIVACLDYHLVVVVLPLRHCPLRLLYLQASS
jgi:hypothetical protein